MKIKLLDLVRETIIETTNEISLTVVHCICVIGISKFAYDSLYKLHSDYKEAFIGLYQYQP
jgi:hypothetical protein